jgi:hypothetical protein
MREKKATELATIDRINPKWADMTGHNEKDKKEATTLLAFQYFFEEQVVKIGESPWRKLTDSQDAVWWCFASTKITN